MFSNLFPGFGIAVVAFTAYVIADNLVHPDNIEQLKKQAQESANRPSMLTLLKGNKGSAGEAQEQQQ
jgi:NADH dehydrogenase (ubiquinone) 1 beta subcomplex subunit 3